MIINTGNLRTLNRGFSAAFREGFGAAETDDALVAMSSPSTTSEQEYAWLGQFPGLREWVGERVLRGITQHGYSIRNRKFETTVEVLRDSIEDDQHGVYSPLMMEMGRAAAAHPTELVYEALKAGFQTACYDGQYFFDTDHDVEGSSVSNTGGGTGVPWFLLALNRAIKPIILQRRTPYEMQAMMDPADERVFTYDKYRYGVRGRCNTGYGLWQLAYGSKQTLDAAAYAAARKTLLEMKGDGGRPLGIMPTHLIVPPSLEGAARRIVGVEYGAGGATNEWYGTATPHVTPWLA